MCVNSLSGVDHGTLNEGVSSLTSNPLASALGSHTGLRGISFCCSIFAVFFT